MERRRAVGILPNGFPPAHGNHRLICSIIEHLFEMSSVFPLPGNLSLSYCVTVQITLDPFGCVHRYHMNVTAYAHLKSPAATGHMLAPATAPAHG